MGTNNNTIPMPEVPYEMQATRPDVVKPISEVPKASKKERATLRRAVYLLAAIRGTGFQTDHRVAQLRTEMITRKNAGFTSDKGGGFLARMTMDVKEAFEDFRDEVAENGAIAQALEKANNKETKEDSNSGDDDNNNDDTPSTPYYGKREVPEGYVVPECPKELLNYGGNEQGLSADKTSRGRIIAYAGKGKGKGEGGGGGN